MVELTKKELRRLMVKKYSPSQKRYAWVIPVKKRRRRGLHPVQKEVGGFIYKWVSKRKR